MDRWNEAANDTVLVTFAVLILANQIAYSGPPFKVGAFLIGDSYSVTLAAIPAYVFFEGGDGKCAIFGPFGQAHGTT